MKDQLAKLLQGHTLSRAQTQSAFAQIMDGKGDPAQVGALLALLAAREPTVEELIGVAQVMREKVLPIPAPPDVIDTCGTGGIGSRVFNVSTAAGIVAAACGVPVAKHGNRSVTSRSGSSDVLTLLGVNIQADAACQARCLAEAGICFAFAPRHHPAMKHVAAVRQALGFATIFNLVGPLTNPAGARRQLVGVKSPGLADRVLAVLVDLGAQRAMVVHGFDAATPDGPGLCELSTVGPTYVVSFDGLQAQKYELEPESLGLKRSRIAEIEVADSAASAAVIRGVLAGQPGPARNMVLLNSAAALWVGGKVDTVADGLTRAAEALDSGRAAGTLDTLVRISNESP
jgi:anthranilate phosphoribosyltransferase